MTTGLDDDTIRAKTPIRERVGRSKARPRATTSGFTWLPPDQVPGAILPASVMARLSEQAEEERCCRARAMASARNYVVYR